MISLRSIRQRAHELKIELIPRAPKLSRTAWLAIGAAWIAAVGLIAVWTVA